jgi:hypothetical protein
MLIFKGQVIGGKFKRDDQEKFDEYVSGLKDGDYIEQIKKVSGNRSLKQNAYLWGVIVQILSDFTGYEPEEMYDILEFKFLKEYDESGNFYKVGKFKRLEKPRFEEVAAKIRQWASVNLGVQIPEPNETPYTY